MNWKDTLYIAYRCGKAEFSRVVFRIEALLHSIQPGKVVFCSTEGMGGYGDNPKAIAEKLHADHPEYELVWLVNDMRKTFPPYIRKAPNTLWSRAYEYATARVWVDCHRKPFGTRKRAGQHYLQTFHCDICFKPLGADRGGKMPRIAEMVSEADSALIDLWLTSSKWNEDMVRRAMYYHGPVERVGSPRCDILFHERTSLSPQIRERFHIPQDAQILLFAPTFRAGSQTRHRTVEAEEVTLDFQQVLDALEARTGHSWYLMLRLHPQVAAHMEKYPLAQNVRHVVDASQYGDAYELEVVTPAGALQENYVCCREVTSSAKLAAKKDAFVAYETARIRAFEYYKQGETDETVRKDVVDTVANYSGKEADYVETYLYGGVTKYATDPNEKGIVKYVEAATNSGLLSSAGIDFSTYDITQNIDTSAYAQAINDLVEREPENEFYAQLKTQFEADNE